MRQEKCRQTYSAMVISRRRREERRRKFQRICCALSLGVVLLALLPIGKRVLFQAGAQQAARAKEFLESLEAPYGREGLSQGDYPEDLLELLEKNEEAYGFVTDYPNREAYLGKPIDLSGDYEAGKVPLLMQWDRRWGYDSYGDGIVGLAGCGPTCMTMAYVYLTGDLSMNPRAMAEYAYGQGYYTEAGTSWSFFTEGAAGLGLSGRELPLGEAAMKQSLDEGRVIICSMRPGDFTTTGHFILLRGYDGKGFFVNDPNSRKNSGRQWDFETLSGQIKGLWEIGR